MGCHGLLQGIFPIQGLNLCSLCPLHWQAGSLPLAPRGKPPLKVDSSCNYLCAMLCLVTLSCPTLCDPMDCSPPGSSAHGDSPGKNTGVGCHFLLQGISSTQGLNLHLLCPLHWQAGSLPLLPPETLPLDSKFNKFHRNGD